MSASNARSEARDLRRDAVAGAPAPAVTLVEWHAAYQRAAAYLEALEVPPEERAALASRAALAIEPREHGADPIRVLRAMLAKADGATGARGGTLGAEAFHAWRLRRWLPGATQGSLRAAPPIARGAMPAEPIEPPGPAVWLRRLARRAALPRLVPRRGI